mgnify:CR=1 FL=1
MSDLWKKYKKGIAVAFLGIVVLLAAVGVYVMQRGSADIGISRHWPGRRLDERVVCP